MKNTIVLFLLSIGVTTTSCAIMEESQIALADGIVYTVVEPIRTKSVTQADSLQIALECQINKKLFLVHQIRKTNGVFVLDLTDQDIVQLSIPDSLCIWANEFLDELNGNGE